MTAVKDLCLNYRASTLAADDANPGFGKDLDAEFPGLQVQVGQPFFCALLSCKAS